MSKSIEIQIEVEREFVINRNGSDAVIFCETCPTPSQMVSVDEAALLTGTNSRSIFAKVEDDGLHYHETDDGLLLICVNSLTASATTNLEPKGGQYGI